MALIPEASPQEEVRSIARHIIASFQAKSIDEKPRTVYCEDGEINRLDFFVSGVSIKTVIQMNISMAKELAHRTKINDIVPLFILAEQKEMG